MTMANSPKGPSERYTTAHGNRKMTSMSNTMKIIATRKNFTGKRCGGSRSGMMPHS